MGAWTISLKRRVSVLFLAFAILLFSNSSGYSQWTGVLTPSVSAYWWLYDVYFSSPTEGWAVGRDFTNQVGVLLYYSGGTWASVPPPFVSTGVGTGWWLNGVHLSSPTEGWAVGEDATNAAGVLLHYSGGTWTSVPPPSVSTAWMLEDVHFTSPTQGWAVGYDLANFLVVLLHYSGGTWTSVPPPSVSTSWTLNAVHFTSPTQGWAVGWDLKNHVGVLLYYSGGTWTSAPPPSVSTDWGLNDVHFTSPTEGWAVGEDLTNHAGVLLHYSGGTWTSVPPPSVSTDWFLSAVHFTSPTQGWGVGRDSTNDVGVLLHYSGGTWTSVSLPFVNTGCALRGVYFTSPTEGWAVGLDQPDHAGILLHFMSPISPLEGTIGTEITITGIGFGSKKGKVLVGNVAPKVLEWTDLLIRCRFLKPPSLGPGPYNVTIQPPKGASPITLEYDFTVMAPDINWTTPTHASAGAHVIIQGPFFGTKKGKVTLGGKSCKVSSWTMDPTTGESEINFIVPKGLSPGAADLKVTNGLGSVITSFTVD